MKTKNLAAIYAVSAAALYAVNIPLSKLILNHAGTTMTAAFLYLGAGLGLMLYGRLERRAESGKKQERLTRKELPYTAAMVVLDILAPILLMLGIARTNSANVSLLNNFEIVATSVIALVIFKETISLRLWLAVLLVTAASVVLSFEGSGAFAVRLCGLRAEHQIVYHGSAASGSRQDKRLLFSGSFFGRGLQPGVSGGKAGSAILYSAGDHGREYGADGKRQHPLAARARACAYAHT